MTKVTPTEEKHGPHLISIASGKGGVGKTNVSLNLAWALGAQGFSVCILDADLGLSNVDILLGIRPTCTLADVLLGKHSLAEAIMHVGPGVDLISGASGVPRLAELNRNEQARLLQECKALNEYDYVLIDNSPGITGQVTSLCLSAKDIIIVVNPEASSITDAYALIKVLSQNGLWWSPLVLLNRVRGTKQAEQVFAKIQNTASNRLNLNCSLLGYIPEDGAIRAASALQRPLLETAPGALATRAFTDVAKRLSMRGDRLQPRSVSASTFLENSITRLREQGARRKQVPAEAKKELRNMRSCLSHMQRLVEHVTHLPLSTLAPLQTEFDRMSNHVEHLESMLGFSKKAPRTDEPAPESKSATHPVQKNPASPRALLVCPDDTLFEVLSEILNNTGFAVSKQELDADKIPAHTSALLVICISGPGQDAKALLGKAPNLPTVWLRGYRSKNEIPTPLPLNLTVVEKPFVVKTLQSLFRKSAGLPQQTTASEKASA